MFTRSYKPWLWQQERQSYLPWNIWLYENTWSHLQVWVFCAFVPWIWNTWCCIIYVCVLVQSKQYNWGHSVCFFLAWRLISSGYLVITISSCQTKCSTTHKHKQITFFLSFSWLICPFKHLGHSSPPPISRPKQESDTFSWTYGTKLKDVIQ